VLQQIKTLLRDQLGLPPLAILVVAGLIAHLLLNLLLRKMPTSPWGLLAPLVLGITLEAWEIWIQYKDIGLAAPQSDPLTDILARHALDVLAMLAGPALLVIAGALSSR